MKPRKRKIPRNLKTFIRKGKRYRVVYSSPDQRKTVNAANMYPGRVSAVYYDTVTQRWQLGLR